MTLASLRLCVELVDDARDLYDPKHRGERHSVRPELEAAYAGLVRELNDLELETLAKVRKQVSELTPLLV